MDDVPSARWRKAPSSAWGVSPGVIARAACTHGTSAMLTLSHDDGHVEAEVELHSDQAGDAWKVRFYNDNVRAATVWRQTGSADGGGSLSVSRLLTHHPGSDAIAATAINQVTKERCLVRATI
jgi:hypothetical protein